MHSIGSVVICGGGGVQPIPLGSGVNELTMTSSGRVQQAEPAMTMMGHYTPASAVAVGGAPSLLGEWGCHAVGI